MFRHIAMFQWAEGIDRAGIDRVLDALATLPGAVPTIRSFTVGRDAGLREGNFDCAVVADFDDEAGYLVYRDDEHHQRIIRDVITPSVRNRAAIQFSVD